MTTLSSWSYTQALTFWSAAVDAWGQPTLSLAFTAPGTWQIGGDTQSDDQGIQFTPASTFWIERGPADVRPARGWKVAIGIHAGQPPVSAEIIRKVGTDDDSMHGFDAVDFVMWS